jgi:hypothetical protein
MNFVEDYVANNRKNNENNGVIFHLETLLKCDNITLLLNVGCKWKR